MFKKVETEKVYMKIVKQMLDLIKEGKLKPGDKLPSERLLTEKFGASRPSLREALSALEILGIIESRGGKGNFIRNDLKSPSYEEKIKELQEEQSPFELLEVRKVIETETASLAAKRYTQEDLDIMEKLINKIKEPPAEISYALDLDYQFHLSIAKATHNTLFIQIMIYLTEGLKEDLWRNTARKTWNIPGHPQRCIQEHTAIFNAIKDRNSKNAKERMYEHLIGVEKDLFLSDNGVMEGS